jgi:hypothetical protein
MVISKPRAPAVQYYQANIHRIGAQAGFSSNVTLGWAVFAPTLCVGPGALAGVYGGLSAGAAIGVGVGVGANGRVGGNNSFALRDNLGSTWSLPQLSLSFSPRLLPFTLPNITAITAETFVISAAPFAAATGRGLRFRGQRERD